MVLGDLCPRRARGRAYQGASGRIEIGLGRSAPTPPVSSHWLKSGSIFMVDVRLGGAVCQLGFPLADEPDELIDIRT